MNLDRLVDPVYGLQEDEWSLTAPRFGKEGQLTVVGWSGKTRAGRGNKFYILRCDFCIKDTELHGDGYFRSLKHGLISGKVPCGCTFNPRWSKEQYSIICSRKALELGYKFLEFGEMWLGHQTKIRVLCEKHGEWDSGTITSLCNQNCGCPSCGLDKGAESNTKLDSVVIQTFFDSKGFHPDTKFWRSDRKDSRGCRPYWNVYCPDCEETGEATGSDFQRGQRPCACSKQRQQECYINWVIDDHKNAVAIKFGVARDSKRRIKQQNSKSVYALKQHNIYSFPSVQQCKRAERECKRELECGILLRRDMPDGWTETTYVYNLDKIIEIYERNGGVKIDLCETIGGNVPWYLT